MTEELRVSKMNQGQSSGHRGQLKTDVSKVYKDNKEKMYTVIGMETDSLDYLLQNKTWIQHIKQSLIGNFRNR